MAPHPASPGRRRDAVLELHKDRLGFAAAHFSILEGGSERIHGHNYRVGLRAHGSIRSDGTVVDFGALKSALGRECAALDHHMLIPGDCPDVAVEEQPDGHVAMRQGQRRFLFPAAEVRILPVRNTTCECLAEYLVERLRVHLGELPVRLEVTVEESPGQGATVGEPAL
jgi:6-pyruvoyltetrahydropterin/6-carboxytetrahydropterin synthase